MTTNAPTNAMPESPVESQATAPAVIPAARLMYWAVRRELWENRSIYLAPLGVAALFLVGFLISMIAKRLHVIGGWTPNPAGLHGTLEMPYELVAALVMGVALLVGVFYSVDALYGERRDRSILFWKSLPVSDLTTVLAKVSVPLFVIPLLSFVITLVTQLVMLLLSSIVMLGSSLSVPSLWGHSSFLYVSLVLLYHLLTVHGLWYAPIFGWLLMVSAWARRAPFLWAFLPPFVICGFEKITFNTTYFLEMLLRRLAGPEPSMPAPPGSPFMSSLMALGPGQFFSEPGLWIGLAIAAAFLFAAVRLRRSSGPI